MKKYIKPNLDELVIEATDVITTSSGAALNDIVYSLASSGARTQAYDFTGLFGE